LVRLGGRTGACVMTSASKLLGGAAGTSAAGVANPDTLIEGNFSIDVYNGTEAELTIDNSINLSGKGGLVWIKNRGIAFNHHLFDTERGVTKWLISNGTTAETTTAQTLKSFNNNGFTLGTDAGVNHDSDSVAWTFKKAPKFFDVVTYTGNDTSGRTIAHSLGTAVGMIAVKNLSRASDWAVFHRSSNSAPQDYVLEFQNANDAFSSSSRWNDTAPTSSVFTVGDYVSVNQNGDSYVAYLWAHETGDDSMIQCGGYTGNGSSTGPVVDLGFEPQFLMIKGATTDKEWRVHDTMRGMPVSGSGKYLEWNSSNAEAGDTGPVALSATGFQLNQGGSETNDDGKKYIYMAIRRPNMATITDATEVFATDTRTNSEGEGKYDSGFPVDFSIARTFDATSNNFALTRLTNEHLKTNNDGTDSTSDGDVLWDVMDGFTIGGSGLNAFFGSSTDNINWMWKRAKGYFDVVAYTGTGSTQTVAHGLTVAPEMMWIKNRGVADNWAVYYGDNTDYLILNTTAATADSANWWNDTSPTSSVFTVKSDHSVNASSEIYIAYLFATLAGVSKVGSVTHSGSSTDVDCGFSAGSRFVLLKRTDATGSWFVWDSTRGIIAGNDPYVLLDTTAAQVTNTDYIDPLASGFQISGDFTDGDYIFYAIA